MTSTGERNLALTGVSGARRRSSGHDAAEYIRRLIFDGHLRPGERVPQDQIAQVLSISRIPVREGLIALERDGWVTIELNRGAYVNALDADAVRDNYELFGMLYGFATRRAAGRADESLVPRLAEIEKVLRKTDDPVRFRDATLLFHDAIVAAARSPRVKVMLRSSTGLVSGNFFEEIDGAIGVERRGTTAIVRALRYGDAEEAAEHYRRTMIRQGELVVKVFQARGLFDSGGRPPEGDWLGTPFLRFERRGSIALVTVDRPQRRNAMTPAMYFGARYAVDHVNQSDDLAALVFTGTGDVFIPGGDLGGDQEDGWGDLGRLLHYDNVPFEAVRNSAKPVVSAVNGICQGGGLLIAMFSDVAVAATSSTFRAPEVLRGIADTGYAAALPTQIGVARARDMLLTGRTIDAPTALEWGLVSRLADDADVLDDAVEVAKQLARGGPNAYRVVKREVNRGYPRMDRMSMDESLSGEEPIEGFHAFRERRSPAWVPDDLQLDGRL